MAKSFWDKPPIAIVHRGGAARHGRRMYQEENTLTTFQQAVGLGYKYLELDVTSTKDGKVIVVHVSLDPIEKRVRKDAPDALKMQQYTHAELRQLLKRKIPTLEEVFKSFPKSKFFIDAKTDEVVEPLTRVIRKTRSEDRVFLNSFFLERVKKIQRLLNKGAATGLIISRYPRALNKNFKKLMAGDIGGHELDGIVLPYRFLSKKAVEKVHEQGMRLVVWTPNSEKQIQKSIKLEVDGIMSDKAELLIKMLKKA